MPGKVTRACKERTAYACTLGWRRRGPLVRRRITYILVSIVTLNVVLAGAIFVRMQNKDQCDVAARGLVVWIDDRARWETLSLPSEETDLPPCRARTRTDLVMLPG